MISSQTLLESLQRALQSERPVLLVLAGSNGAGKSTFYDLFLSALGLPFVNADLIARTLYPQTPELALNAQSAMPSRRLASWTSELLLITAWWTHLFGYWSGGNAVDVCIGRLEPDSQKSRST